MTGGGLHLQTTTNQGCTLHIKVEGPDDGPTVMFANSLGTDLRIWDLMIPHLPKGLRLIRFDNRGHGLSDCPDAPYDIDTLANDAAAVADAVNAMDIAFVGLSIGGLIGQGLAAKRPDLIKSLTLMDTAAKIGTASMWEDRINAVAAKGLPAMADTILDRWFEPPLRTDTKALAPWRNMLSRTPLEGYLGCCHAIAGADFTTSTAALEIPLIGIAGAKDKSTPPHLVEATTNLVGAPCHVIPDAGHLPCAEKPAETAAILTQFLKDTNHV